MAPPRAPASGRERPSSERKPTIKEVAELAGVAASSVSRALNNHPDVGPEMRTRVMRAVEQLRYEPDFVARSLRLRATRSVGFVVRDISNPLFANIIKGAEQALEKHGYSTLLMNSLGDPSRDAHHIQVLRQRRVDGLIASLQSETNPDTIAALREMTTPVVLLDRTVGGTDLSSVLCDHFGGVYDAVRSLIELGHRRLAVVAGSSELSASRERVRGFRQACQDMGLPVDEVMVRMGSYSEEFGFATALDLLDMAEPPTAVIAGGIQLGTGALRAMHGRGVLPGRELSFVVCDDVPLFEIMRPALSVVVRDTEAMGRLAAELMIEHLQDPNRPPRCQVIPTRYVARSSSRAPSDLTHRAPGRAASGLDR